MKKTISKFVLLCAVILAISTTAFAAPVPPYCYIDDLGWYLVDTDGNGLADYLAVDVQAGATHDYFLEGTIYDKNYNYVANGTFPNEQAFVYEFEGDLPGGNYTFYFKASDIIACNGEFSYSINFGETYGDGYNNGGCYSVGNQLKLASSLFER